MASNSLQALHIALIEIADLSKANPSPTGSAPTQPAITRAIGRSTVVLLCSHFERYIRAVNEEASNFVITQPAVIASFPKLLRLLHSRQVVDELEQVVWDNRSDKLVDFVKTDSWMWGSTNPPFLEHHRLLVWMKSPKPDKIIRYFRYWGIDDIFSAITRRRSIRDDLWLRLSELVDKRNNIAHGDFATVATQADTRKYVQAVSTFCERADHKFSQVIGRLLGVPNPW